MTCASAPQMAGSAAGRFGRAEKLNSSTLSS